MPGIKHLVQCHCVLAIYKTGEDIVNHMFPVYSKIDKNNKIVPKLIKCNNCETMHYVHDVCKSEIRGGKDQSGLTLTIEDLSLSLPERLSNVLFKTQTDISNWEHIVDIFDEERWGEEVVLRREIIGEKQHLKSIIIQSEKTFKIKNRELEDTIV